MKILVPVDGSEAAGRAAAFAAKLAQAFQGRITLLNVFDAPSATTLGLVALAQEHLDAARAELSKAAFEKAEAQLGGLSAERVEELGEPSKQILALAKHGGFDHIVMGGRGLSPMQEILLGSVSERVLRHTPCPVTIVH